MHDANAIGYSLPSDDTCKSTAPNPYTGASPDIFKGREASKCAKTGAVLNHAFAS